tara:strand:- start:528 stop:674 length:147 start_codon:yes stop_codon:yes gene_type:complete
MLVLNKVCLKKGHTHFEKVGTRILKSEHMYFEALKLAHANSRATLSTL